MPDVHSTAIIDGDVTLADDVMIGQHCVLDGTAGPMRIGKRTRLIGNVYLTGPLTMGQHNTVYPFACLGFPPQDLKWDSHRPGAGVEIGDGNIFRESVTIHRAASDTAPTRIGSNNYWMAMSHAGHDAIVGDNCTFANAVALGGCTQVADRVVIGGATVIHQFCRIGHGCMLSGAMGLSLDLPPHFMLTGNNVAGSINLVGLRRAGVARDVIDDVRWAYKTLYRRGLSLKGALDELRGREDSATIREYIEFIEQSKRGICPARGKTARSAS